MQLILGLLFGSLLQLIFPFLTQAIVDIGIGGKDIGFIWLVLLTEIMLLFCRTAIDFIQSKILLHISTRINISLISDFFIKIMKFFDTKLLGDILQRIEDHRRVEQFLTSSSLSLLFSFSTFLVFGIVLAVYNLPIFAVFLVGTALYAGWIVMFLKKSRQLDYKYFEQAGRNRNVTYQLINGMQEIKLQSCKQRKRWEREDVQADLFKVNLQSLNLQQIQQGRKHHYQRGKEHLNHGACSHSCDTRKHDSTYDARSAVHHRSAQQPCGTTHPIHLLIAGRKHQP